MKCSEHIQALRLNILLQVHQKCSFLKWIYLGKWFTIYRLVSTVVEHLPSSQATQVRIWPLAEKLSQCQMKIENFLPGIFSGLNPVEGSSYFQGTRKKRKSHRVRKERMTGGRRRLRRHLLLFLVSFIASRSFRLPHSSSVTWVRPSSRRAPARKMLFFLGP